MRHTSGGWCVAEPFQRSKKGCLKVGSLDMKFPEAHGNLSRGYVHWEKMVTNIPRDPDGVLQ